MYALLQILWDILIIILRLKSYIIFCQKYIYILDDFIKSDRDRRWSIFRDLFLKEPRISKTKKCPRKRSLRQLRIDKWNKPWAFASIEITWINRTITHEETGASSPVPRKGEQRRDIYVGISLRKELIIVGNQRVQRAAALSSKINESKSNRKISWVAGGRTVWGQALKTAMHSLDKRIFVCEW